MMFGFQLLTLSLLRRKNKIKNYTPSSGKLRPDILSLHCLPGLCEGSIEHGECTHLHAYTYRP